MKRSILSTAVLLALFGSVAAHAAQFGIYDPRSLGMGGVGVSTATSRNAAFFNPALLSTTNEDDDFALGLPIVSGRAVDRNNLIDDIDRLEPVGDQLSFAIDALNASIAAVNVPQSQLDAARLAAALNSFNTELSTTSNKSLDAEVFAAGVLAVPGRDLGMGIYASGRAEFAADFRFAPTDSALLANLSGLATTYAGSGNPADLLALTTQLGTNPDGSLADPNLASTVRLRGILFKEVGVSLSSRFESLGGIDIGVTPKVVQATTVDYLVTAQNSDIDLDRGKLDTNGMNLDVGVAKDYDGRFKAGVVMKNVFKKSYATVLGNTIELKPQVRAGVSHHTGWSTVGLDVDLTENDHSGLGKGTQYAALGAEFDVGVVQLRVGFRHDLAGSYKDAASLGLGFNLFGLHVDVAAAGNADDAAGAVQLGLNF